MAMSRGSILVRHTQQLTAREALLTCSTAAGLFGRFLPLPLLARFTLLRRAVRLFALLFPFLIAAGLFFLGARDFFRVFGLLFRLRRALGLRLDHLAVDAQIRPAGRIAADGHVQGPAASALAAAPVAAFSQVVIRHFSLSPYLSAQSPAKYPAQGMPSP